CRAIAGRMADMAGGQLGWDQLAEGMALKQAVATGDAVSAIDVAEASRGNQGVPWVGGAPAGGTAQPPVSLVGAETRAGFNPLNGRAATEADPIAPADCAGNLACETWNSPDAAAAWAVRVLGEQEQRTCESCIKTVTTRGAGLTPADPEEFEGRPPVPPAAGDCL